MMAKKKENFLDYTPKRNARFHFFKDEKEHLIVRIYHKGLMNKSVQILLKKPAYTDLEFDEFGTFIIGQMDGKRTVYEIAKAVSNQFGTRAEPLYERLITFLKILHKNCLIVYTNK
ncbi:MAG: PqqD family protein [Lachnospiraceae bacterium]|uniref:PqqD family protein n=1 Tax=Roseburia hominis TaxID=301301 RepID=UPI001F3BC67D|nr:PqqD family protein [Roseburia hominis]MCI5713348.1 PqqD family protein [Lachnospiraceae bacterium]MDD6170703.1 PqqD family protein [Lachnospiraceae bacterium]MDY4840026.1 PqqD family protein [Lachnospiraceae bacterium]